MAYTATPPEELPSPTSSLGFSPGLPVLDPIEKPTFLFEKNEEDLYWGGEYAEVYGIEDVFMEMSIPDPKSEVHPGDTSD
jgi:hypothetical protein